MGNQTRKRGCFHRLNGQLHRQESVRIYIYKAIDNRSPGESIIPGKGTAHSQIRKKKTAIISLIDEYPKTVFYSSEMNSS